MNTSTRNPVNETDQKTTDFRAQVRDLWLWVAALSRRVEELEASAFQLVDEEEVILVATPNTRKLCDCGVSGNCSLMKYMGGRPRSFHPEF